VILCRSAGGVPLCISGGSGHFTCVISVTSRRGLAVCFPPIH